MGSLMLNEQDIVSRIGLDKVNNSNNNSENAQLKERIKWLEKLIKAATPENLETIKGLLI